MIDLVGLAGAYPKVYLAFVIIASLALMIKSSDLLLYGVTRYARRVGLSDYLTGLVVIAIVASFPELVSSVTGAIAGDHGIVFGAILGSNVGGLTLILGVMAIMGKKLDIRSKLFDKVKLLVFAFTLLPLVLVIDGSLSRIDGGILVLAYTVYLVWLWKKEKDVGSLKKTVKIKVIWKDALVFILALGALLLSARFLIFGVGILSGQLGISTFIVSVVILGIGAQIPDLIVIVRSQAQGHKDVGMGDLLGSTLAKQLLFLGLIALVVPLHIGFSVVMISSIALAVSMGLVLLFMKTGWITWKGGILVLLIYGTYLLLEVVFGVG
jgi:cation:H+ antiporter